MDRYMCVYIYTYIDVVVLSICRCEGALTISVRNAKQNEKGSLCPHLVIPIPQNPVVPANPGASLPLCNPLPH